MLLLGDAGPSPSSPAPPPSLLRAAAAAFKDAPTLKAAAAARTPTVRWPITAWRQTGGVSTATSQLQEGLGGRGLTTPVSNWLKVGRCVSGGHGLPLLLLLLMLANQSEAHVLSASTSWLHLLGGSAPFV